MIRVYPSDMLHVAPWLIFTVIQHWDYFTTCIYTPQEYARDQNDFHWDLRGKEFSYKAIHSYFRGLARGQYGLLKERSDIQTFSECLPRLLNLTTIKLSFTGAKEDQLLWFTNRIYLESGDSFPIHLETVLRGMVKSQHNGIIVESIEIDGMHPYSTTTEGDILEIAGAALMHVKTFKLMGSSSLLELMSSIPLPSLRRFELANCWLAGSDLIRFLEFHQGIVQHAHFHSISLFYERFGETDRCSETLQRLLEVVSDSGNIGKLENLVILCHPQI